MPKDVLTEGIVDKIITKIFTSILKGKQRGIMKAVDKDPKLKKLAKDTQDSFDNLHDYLRDLEKRREKTGKHFPPELYK